MTSNKTISGPITSPVYTQAANGSGLDYAIKCDAEWSNYNEYISSGAPAHNITTTLWSTFSNFSASVSWLCNNTDLPHVIGSLTLTAVESMSDVYTNTVRDLPSASPSCSVRPDDCVALTNLVDKDYSSALTSMDKGLTSLVFSSTTALLVGNSWSGFNTTTFPVGLPTPPILTFRGTALTPDASSDYTIYYTGPWGPTNAFLKPNLTGSVYGSGSPIPQTSINCTTTRPTGTAASQCGQCTIGGGRVELLYFPVTEKKNATREMCSPYYKSDKVGTACPFGATRAATSGEPTIGRHGVNNYCYYTSWYSTSIGSTGSYIVSDGSTYYKDQAYISLESATAADSCGPVGGSYTGRVIGLPSSDVYSVCGWTGEATLLGYDFADLQSTVPPAAYNCQPVCDSDGYVWDIVNGQFFGDDYAYKAPCGLIVDEWYKPILAVPPQIRQLDPDWADCALDLDGLYDPPKPLTAVTTVAGPASGPTPEPASPGSSKTSEQPPETNKPSPAPAPTPTADPGTQPTTGETSVGQSGGSPGSTAAQTSRASSAVIAVPDSTLKTPTTVAPSDGATASDKPGNSNSGSGSADPGGLGGVIASLVQTTAATTPKSSAGSGDAIASAIASIIGASPPASGVATTAVDPGSSDPGAGGAGAGTSDPSGSGSGSSGSTATGSGSGSGSSGSGNSGSGSSGSGSGGSASGSTGSTNTGTGADTGSADSGNTGSGGSGASSGGSDNAAGNSAGSAGSNGVNTDPNNASPGSPAQGAVVTVGSQTLTISTAGSSGAIVVGSQTLQPGGAFTALNGAVVSAKGSGVAVAGSQVAFTPLPTPGAVVGTTVHVGGQTLTASQDPAGELVIGTATLSPGQVTTLSGGAVVSAGPSGLVIDRTSTVPLQALTQVTRGPQLGAVITAGSQTLTAVQLGGGSFVIAGTTISSGLAVTLSDGQIVTAGSSGLIVDGTSTVSLQALSRGASDSKVGAVFTAGSQAITAVQLGGGSFALAGTTLTSGQIVTLGDGEVLSVGSAGLIVDGTSTLALQTLPPLITSPSTLFGAVLAINGQTITASQISSGTYVIGTQTITAGQTYTLSNGEVISAGPSGLVLDGTSTLQLSSITLAASTSLVTLGGQVFSAVQTGSVEAIGSVTLTVGGAAATVNGVEVSLASTGLIMGGLKTTAGTASGSPPTETGAPSSGMVWPPGHGVALIVAVLVVCSSL
ncbi:hypothetical protein B0A48_02374 [Cryoendolithus antarcticus]|uniref:Uncharacterized protein n=1 Tax=Cryoendolithus antarcticus TaxID=1507870 RepID=A0A1V8TNG8_9PEZI|nr:hypothetical protein B0A48_02374 [Cryoendolithus antarcticus]